MLDVFNDGWIESASGTGHVMKALPLDCCRAAGVVARSACYARLSNCLGDASWVPEVTNPVLGGAASC